MPPTRCFSFRLTLFSALITTLFLSATTLPAFGQSQSDVIVITGGRMSEKEWHHGIGGGDPLQQKCYGMLNNEDCTPVTPPQTAVPEYDWDQRITATGGNAVTGASYARSKGNVNNGVLTINEDLYLKWINNGGLNFGWPGLDNSSSTTFYVKGPAGTPVTFKAKINANNEASNSYPLDCSRIVLAQGFDRSICPDQPVSIDQTFNGQTDGPAIFYNGEEYHRATGFSTGLGVDQNGSGGGTHIQHLTVDGSIRVCRGTACLDGPPIAKIRGPIVDDIEVSKVSAGDFALFFSDSYDPDNNQGTTPGAGIVNNSWTITDPNGVVTSGGSAFIDYTPLTIGNYQVSLTVTDDEGQTATTQTSFTVEASIEIVGIEGSNPTFHDFYLRIIGGFQSHQVCLEGPGFPRSCGSYRSPLSDTQSSLDGLALYHNQAVAKFLEQAFNNIGRISGKYKFTITGINGSSRVSASATFDYSFLNKQGTRKGWRVKLNWPHDPLPNRTVTITANIGVHRWEWDKPYLSTVYYDRVVVDSVATIGGTMPIDRNYTNGTMASLVAAWIDTSSEGVKAMHENIIDEVPTSNYSRSFTLFAPEFKHFGRAGLSTYGYTITGHSLMEGVEYQWIFPTDVPAGSTSSILK